LRTAAAITRSLVVPMPTLRLLPTILSPASFVIGWTLMRIGSDAAQRNEIALRI